MRTEISNGAITSRASIVRIILLGVCPLGRRDDVAMVSSADAVIALPEMDEHKRMNDLLTQGGLL